MRARRICAVIAAAVLAAPAAAYALPSAAPATSAPTAAPTKAMAAVRALAAQQLVRAGVPRSQLIAAGLAESSSSTTVIILFGPGGGADLTPMGDLNRDGAADLLETRYAPAKSPKNLGLFARDGGSGRLLWRRVVPIRRSHFVFALPTRTGAAGQAGTVLIDIGWSDNGSDTLTQSLALTGLDARGNRRWSHSASGTETFDDNGLTLKNAPELDGVLTTTGHAADTLLMSLLTGTYGFDNAIDPFSGASQGDTHGTVRGVTLDAARGTSRRLGADVSSPDAFPHLQAMPDVSGDGRADVACVAPGSHPRLEVRDVSGKAIWSNTTLAMSPGAWVLPAGRVTGAKAGGRPVPDLAVTNPAADPVTSVVADALPVSVPDPVPFHGNVSLVKGSDGSAVWTKSGDGAFAVERAGPQLVPALGVYTSTASEDPAETTESLTVSSYDVAGTELYAVTRSVSVPTSTDPEAFHWAVGYAYEAGHLTGTTATDGRALLLAMSGDTIKVISPLFSGQTGQDIADHQSEPLWGSTTGHGDDLVSISTSGTLSVTVRRGSDGAIRFHRSLPGATGYDDAYAMGFDKGRCDDVLVAASASGGRRLSAVLSSTGQLRWMLTHSDTDLRPGAVRRGPASSRPCR